MWKMEDDVKKVNSRINEILIPDEPRELSEAMRHLILSGGKRLRPIIAMHSAGAIKPGAVGKGIDVGVALELIHNFTLIHDDIMDKSLMRRHVKTTHIVFGDEIAIDAGDGLFAKALLLIYEMPHTRRLLGEVSQMVYDLCRGQAMDVIGSQKSKSLRVRESKESRKSESPRVVESDSKDPQTPRLDRLTQQYRYDSKTPDLPNSIDDSQTSLDWYLKMIEYKTARLLEVSARCGAIVAGATDAQQEALGRFGWNLGMAFQIQDDLLDAIGGERTGKAVGGDIREGKNTILVVYALSAASSASEKDRKTIRSGMGRGDKVGEVIEAFRRAGSIDFARKLAVEYAENARKAISKLKDSKDKEILIQILDYAVKREK